MFQNAFKRRRDSRRLSDPPKSEAIVPTPSAPSEPKGTTPTVSELPQQGSVDLSNQSVIYIGRQPSKESVASLVQNSPEIEETRSGSESTVFDPMELDAGHEGASSEGGEKKKVAFVDEEEKLKRAERELKDASLVHELVKGELRKRLEAAEESRVISEKRAREAVLESHIRSERVEVLEQTLRTERAKARANGEAFRAELAAAQRRQRRGEILMFALGAISVAAIVVAKVAMGARK